jgi:prephenate dehydrogenase
LKPIEECTVGIMGLGLMGGAFAIALRNRCGVTQNHLFACDMNREILAEAEESGLIGRGWKGDEDLSGMLGVCDLIFLCLNPSTLIKFLERWSPFFKDGALLTDIAGIKGNVVKAAEKLREDIDLIPGHPMAGAEKGGFVNAGLCNFQDKNYILTTLKRNKPENLNFLKSLIYRIGFSRITEVSAAEHDRKIAFTSQLCHIIAVALIDCENDTDISCFGGGSFEDLTRIAMLNAPMWTELFIENREDLLARLEQFEGSLDALKALIRSADATELEKRLTLVRERRTLMGR